MKPDPASRDAARLRAAALLFGSMLGLAIAAPPPARPSGAAPANAAPQARIEDSRPLRATPAPLDPISDGAIAARVRASILGDPGMAGTDVSVTSDHGVVTLLGTVRSQEQIAIASAYAQREDGVMRVDDELSLSAQ